MGSRLGAMAMQALALILLGLAACASAQYSSCPEPYGLQLYPHEQYCDKFYKCANGTLYEEVCENGLVFDGHGAVHNHCNYNWAVDCGKRVYDDTPISSPGCLYQFGIYPVGEGCQTTFFKCAAGVAYETPCYKGLAYADAQTESVVGFKCPAPHELPPNAVARRFLPYPRFPKPGDETAYIVCVEDSPRIHYCGDNSVFDSQTLTCIYYEDKHLQPQFAAPHTGFGK